MYLSRFIVLLLFICSLNIAYACTSFGVITNSGTLLGKNRDYFYSKQNFVMIEPIKQFEGWYENNYHHKNKCYALIADNDVKFGINEFGLAAIEEDPPFPNDVDSHRRYKQPYQGYSEGMVLYGILQNFITVNEIIPYIHQIFSTAAPNFYQISDKDTILSVEVAYGGSDTDALRKYTYKIINKVGNYFVHANTYLDQEFVSLNKLANNQDRINGCNNRLKKINQYIASANQNFSHAFDWYLDTSSKIDSAGDSNFCLNTSIFRSNTKDLKIIDRDTTSDKVYGTVSSFMVKHINKNTLVYVRILDSIYTLANGDQNITYNELLIPLNELFKGKKLNYKTSGFLRKAPVNGVCQ